MSKFDGTIMTVEGAISPEVLGTTLIHEHLFMDATPMLAKHGYRSDSTGPFDCSIAAEARWNPGVHIDNYRMTDTELIASELADYRASGGVSIVECTPVDMGRNPTAVREIAKAAGVRAILGSGYYLEATHERFVAARSPEQIAEEIIHEFTDGIGTTGIRPGIIGEIGTGDPISSSEFKVLRAAAFAAIATGLTVTVHIHPWGREAEKALGALMDCGMQGRRIILNHMTTAFADDIYQRKLLAAGAYLSYDLFGFDHSALGSGRYVPSDYDVARKIVSLIRDGHRDQILISQDIGVRTRLRRYGGWGYSHILRHVVPLLKEHGASNADIEALLVINPRKVLTVAGPRS